jgi:chemotaxis protein methyltransferase CheR
LSYSASSPLFEQVSRSIEAWMGLFFPPERLGDLERKLQAAAAAFGCDDAESCARLLISSPLTKQQLDLLATYLTVGETYFFREPSSLAIVEQHLLPELLHERRIVDQHLRIWSAACCTGEEPYSIAIILHRLLPDLPAWKITLLATDISRRFLQKATEGVYGQWSFRAVPAAIQEQYFHRTLNGRYVIRPDVKQLVSFAQLNLADNQYPSPATSTGGMDLIFCRNVLIYFSAERTKRVIENFYRCLTDGGWLIVSPVETALVLNSSFTPVHFSGVTLFRKDPERKTAHFSSNVPLLTSVVEHWGPKNLVFSVPDTPDALLDSEHSLLKTDESGSLDNPTPEVRREMTLHAYEEADSAYACGRYGDAIEKLLTIPWDEAPEIFPFPSAREQGMELLTRAYANQGQLAEARLWCDRALAVNMMDPGLHYLRATIALECGQEAEARLSFTHAVSLDQHFVLAHFALGILARQRHERREAREHFATALALVRQYHPDDILPDSEGMSAGRLAQILTEMNENL